MADTAATQDTQSGRRISLPSINTHRETHGLALQIKRERGAISISQAAPIYMPPARLLLSLVRLLLLALAAVSETAAWTTHPRTPTPVRSLHRASVARRRTALTMAPPAAAADDGNGSNVPVIHEPATLNPRAEDYALLASAVDRSGWG